MKHIIYPACIGINLYMAITYTFKLFGPSSVPSDAYVAILYTGLSYMALSMEYMEYELSKVKANHVNK